MLLVIGRTSYQVNMELIICSNPFSRGIRLVTCLKFSFAKSMAAADPNGLVYLVILLTHNVHI